MAFGQGPPPVVPGVTGTQGIAPGGLDPMQMVAMMMGMAPGKKDTTIDKMAKVVQLLREVSKEDPRIALLANDALKLLVEGPQSGPPTAGGSPGRAVSPIPMGGPGVPF